MKRIRFWRFKSRILTRITRNREYYNELNKEVSPYENLILKDIDRTFPFLKYFEKGNDG